MPGGDQPVRLALGLALAVVAAAALRASPPEAPWFPAPVPAGLPAVPVPADNPLTPDKVALGEKLFFEQALSADGKIHCGSCHHPDRYFTDGAALSTGIGGQLGEHNAGSVVNAAYAGHLLWDGRSLSLEDQALYPVTHPREMNNTQEKVVAALGANPAYPPLFARAFGDAGITWPRVAQALASFERTILSGDSPFDRYMAGETAALSTVARNGLEIFRGKAGCVRCHTHTPESPFFSDFAFHNTGVGWADGPDLGRYHVTKEREDKGAFRTPSLRNVAKTAPYMHDGKLATLQEVVAFYGKGGGANPFLDERIQPLALTPTEVAELIAFLESLTGDITYRRSGSPVASEVQPDRASQGGKP